MKRFIFLGAALFVSVSAFANSRLINGKEVEKGTYREVISIVTNGAGCTATVIGPNVIITAAHCANTGATANFKIDGKAYSAKMTRSGLYPAKDHDVNVGVTTEEITDIQPASIGGKASKGTEITLLGYGCTDSGGGGADGKLRVGNTTVVEFNNYDMVSRKAGGAALCFGDSGGPAFVASKDDKHLLLGINSKGNIQDTNYNTRTDITESQDFLKKFAEDNGVQICGINKDCGVTPPPPPTAPTCTLSANPVSLKVGEPVTITMVSQGDLISATIDGTDVLGVAQKTFNPDQPGHFTSKGVVTGTGGTGTCEASYTVVTGPPPPPTAPTCTLSAAPEDVKVGESVTLELKTAGQVTAAAIDGIAVAPAGGTHVIQTKAKGTFTIPGTATGPGGTGTCSATFRVDDLPPPPPSTPNLAVIPTYCGENTMLETKVTTVCLAILKKDATLPDLKMGQVLLITYSDATQEVLPFLSRKTRPKDPAEVTTKEDLTLYANSWVIAKDFLVLDTRTAILTSAPAFDQRGHRVDVPSAIEGRTAKGRYFNVDKLKLHTR